MRVMLFFSSFFSSLLCGTCRVPVRGKGICIDHIEPREHPAFPRFLQYRTTLEVVGVRVHLAVPRLYNEAFDPTDLSICKMKATLQRQLQGEVNSFLVQ